MSYIQEGNYRFVSLITIYAGCVELATLGKMLFKNPTRLLTGAWVLGHRTGTFYQGEASEGVTILAGQTAKVQQNQVADELRLFIELGMIAELPPEPGVRRRYYQRRECAGWEVIAACVKVAPHL